MAVLSPEPLVYIVHCGKQYRQGKVRAPADFRGEFSCVWDISGSFPLSQASLLRSSSRAFLQYKQMPEADKDVAQKLFEREWESCRMPLMRIHRSKCNFITAMHQSRCLSTPQKWFLSSILNTLGTGGMMLSRKPEHVLQSINIYIAKVSDNIKFVSVVQHWFPWWYAKAFKHHFTCLSILISDFMD